MTHTIQAIATDFAIACELGFADGNGKNAAKKFFASLEPIDFVKGINAFVEGVKSHLNKSLVIQHVGQAVLGGKPYSEDEAKQVAQYGFIFTNELATHVGAFTTLQETIEETAKGKIFVKKIAHYNVANTVLADIVGDDVKGSPGLHASPVSDYNDEGFNDEGSIFLKANPHKPAPIIVKAVNLQQHKAYKIDHADVIATALATVASDFDKVVAKAKRKASKAKVNSKA